MNSFTLQDLSDIARDVIGGRRRELHGSMTAADVPGWDSLNHTLIIVEISSRLGIEISPREASGLANLGELVSVVDSRLTLRGGTS